MTCFCHEMLFLHGVRAAYVIIPISSYDNPMSYNASSGACKVSTVLERLVSLAGCGDSRRQDSVIHCLSPDTAYGHQPSTALPNHSFAYPMSFHPIKYGRACV
ncbi:hypothetical protein F5Y01DRAFT_289215 [Xylaria sp. FL0043]|nr:hypothetical protein F5Y01DRAFT_289215 [Xylaria sp. FL0043]